MYGDHAWRRVRVLCAQRGALDLELWASPGKLSSRCSARSLPPRLPTSAQSGPGCRPSRRLSGPRVPRTAHAWPGPSGLATIADHACRRPGGETGRRKRLKISRPSGHAGSTPAPGTIDAQAFGRPSGSGRIRIERGPSRCRISSRRMRLRPGMLRGSRGLYRPRQPPARSRSSRDAGTAGISRPCASTNITLKPQ